jgi:hypothetical protein
MSKEFDGRLTDPKYVQARDAHLARLATIFDGQASGEPFYLKGVTGTAPYRPVKQPVRWVDACLADLADRVENLLDEETFRPLVIQTNPFGVHFVDRIFGAHVFAAENNWWADTLDQPIGRLEAPDLATNETWRLAQTMAETFLASGATVPFFSLPTIASALNIAVNLFGENFLMSMLDETAEALHDLQVINTLLCDLHRWYQEHIPSAQLQPVIAAQRTQPPGYGQLCGCTTHLISGETYRDLVAPLDDQLLATYKHGGMIHLCGAHTQHIPVWREMASLRAVQLNDRAAEDLEVYLQELRDDQIIYVLPNNSMTVERILRITGGNRVVIIGEAPTSD